MTDLKIRRDKCGSELTYQPGTETLVCAYCGNTVKIPTQAVKPEDITDTDLIIPLQIQGDALTNATRVYPEFPIYLYIAGFRRQFSSPSRSKTSLWRPKISPSQTFPVDEL